MGYYIFEAGSAVIQGLTEMSRQKHQMAMLEKGGLIGAGLIVLTGVVYTACNEYKKDRTDNQEIA